MNVYEIVPPDRDGARRIAQAIYHEIRSAHAWGARFPETLGDAPLDALTKASPREMRRAMLNAFGNARIDNRHEVQAKDIELANGSRKKAIGF
jgi:ATP-dependent Lon protease